MNPERVVFMRCPYTAELCDQEATLSDFEVRPLEPDFAGGWKAIVTCLAGHRFVIGQPAVGDLVEENQ